MCLGDAIAHLLGRQAVVVPDHTDNGDIDFGQDVDWGAHHREWCSDQDENRHHDKRVRFL